MASHRIRIDVTPPDIKWGVREDSSRCVVARALGRIVPDATRIEVDTQTIRFTSGGARWCYLTPLRVQNYVAEFDAGATIEPFSFELRDPIRLRRRLVLDEDRPKEAARVAEHRKAARRDVQTPVRHDAAGARPETLKGARTRTSEGRTPPPRVFKTKVRTYGHRQLRINQPRQEST